jgi:hypothetical protein
MPPKLFKLLVAGILAFAFCLTAKAQQQPPKSSKTRFSEPKKNSAGAQLLDLTGKAAVIIVGQSAKLAWQTTKFTASEMAKPVAKAVFLKATPALTKFGLKLTGRALKKGLPVVQKLAITYLRTRMPI